MIHKAKVIVIGPSGVGKTSVVTRCQSKLFYLQMSTTVGAFPMNILLEGDGCKVNMQVWDTAGEERFMSMAPMYYRGSNGAILFFDLTNPDSLNGLKKWTKGLLSLMEPDSLVLVVAGNKCDMVAERRIREKDGRDFAKSIDAYYFETSAKENTGISELFEYVGKEVSQKLKREQLDQQKNEKRKSSVLNLKEELVLILKEELKAESSNNSSCC